MGRTRKLNIIGKNKITTNLTFFGNGRTNHMKIYDSDEDIIISLNKNKNWELNEWDNKPIVVAPFLPDRKTKIIMGKNLLTGENEPVQSDIGIIETERIVVYNLYNQHMNEKLIDSKMPKKYRGFTNKNGKNGEKNRAINELKIYKKESIDY